MQSSPITPTLTFGNFAGAATEQPPGKHARSVSSASSANSSRISSLTTPSPSIARASVTNAHTPRPQQRSIIGCGGIFRQLLGATGDVRSTISQEEPVQDARRGTKRRADPLLRFSCEFCSKCFESGQQLRGHEKFSIKCVETSKKKRSADAAEFAGKSSEAKRLRAASKASVTSNILSRLQSCIMVSLRRDLRAMSKTGDQGRPPRTATKVDFRSGNGGMAKRPGQYTTNERLDIIEDLDAWRDTDEGRGRSVAEFVRAQVLPDCFNKKLSKGKYGWCFPSTRAKLVQLVADGLRKICRTRHSKPKFPLVESLLI